MELAGEGIRLRPWRDGDQEALARHANDPEVARNLLERFPSPYRLRDAEAWIARQKQTSEPTTQFAIEVAGEAGGGIGVQRLDDVYRRTARVGYWLGRLYWGRGLATQAVRLVTGYAFATFDFERLEAEVFDWNLASCRVLEKAGYDFESRQTRRIVKHGFALDGLLYVRLRPNSGPAAPAEK